MKFLGEEVYATVVYKAGNGTVTAIKNVTSVEKNSLNDGWVTVYFKSGPPRYMKRNELYATKETAQQAAISQAKAAIYRVEQSIKSAHDSLTKLHARITKLERKPS